jgi:hypothetical protein
VKGSIQTARPKGFLQPRAQIVSCDAGAVAIAACPAAAYAEAAARRDRGRISPFEARDRFPQSGLWAMTAAASAANRTYNVVDNWHLNDVAPSRRGLV